MKKVKDFFKKIGEVMGFKTADVDQDEMCAVKDTFIKAFKVIDKYKDSKEGDNHTSILEWGGIAKEAVPLLKRLKNYEVIRARLRDYTTSDGKELVQFVMAHGYVHEDATKAVLHVLNIIEMLVIVYNTDVEPLVEILKKHLKKRNG